MLDRSSIEPQKLNAPSCDSTSQPKPPTRMAPNRRSPCWICMHQVRPQYSHLHDSMNFVKVETQKTLQRWNSSLHAQRDQTLLCRDGTNGREVRGGACTQFASARGWLTCGVCVSHGTLHDDWQKYMTHSGTNVSSEYIAITPSTPVQHQRHNLSNQSGQNGQQRSLFQTLLHEKRTSANPDTQ